MAATDDAALARLLDAFARHYCELGASVRREALERWDEAMQAMPREPTYASLLAYLDRAYVRRDRLYDDGPFDPGDGSAYGAALERERD